MTLLAIGSTAIYAFTTWFSAISVLLGLSLTLLVTAVGGIVLPFRQRAMVENSPYGRRILGIPMLSLVAVLALLGFCLGVGVLLWDPGRARASANPGKLGLALGIYVVAFAIYFALGAVRRRQGIDLSLAYASCRPSDASVQATRGGCRGRAAALLRLRHPRHRGAVAQVPARAGSTARR